MLLSKLYKRIFSFKFISSIARGKVRITHCVRVSNC